MTDPAPDDRIYYRHVREGQRGFMVERDGKQLIKLDRPNEEILRPFREHEWMLDREARPLNKHQIGKVSFEADKALCEALGEYDGSKRDWLSLTDEKRIRWIERGPPPGPRKELYNAICKVTRKYTV